MGVNVPIGDKIINHSGIFDIRETYNSIKSYLADSRKYDVYEKEYNGANDSGKKSLEVAFEADHEYDDFFKLRMKFTLNLSGKEINVDNLKFVKGNATLKINYYLELDHSGSRPKGPLASFLDKVYSKYVDKDEFKRALIQVSKDAGGLEGVFKKSMNSPV